MSILQGGHGDLEKENELPKFTQEARTKPGRDTWLYRLVTGSPYPPCRVLAWHDMDRILGTISHLFGSPLPGLEKH